MFAKLASSKRGQRLIPVVIVAIAYSAVFIVPTYRELSRMKGLIEARSASVSLLTKRSQSAELENVKLAAYATESVSQTAAKNVLLSDGESESFVQSFGQVLTVFESHGVECVAAKPDISPGGLNASGRPIHHLTLLGDFQKVLSSMVEIEDDIPSAIATEFTMTRLVPSEPCRWEIAFQFMEGPQ